jgi:AraC-like DNA-binding protein
LPSSHTISWNVSTQTLPDAFERYVVGMADIYEVSGVSEHDRLNFFNASRSTLSAVGGVGEGRSVRQTLARGPAMLRRSEVDGLNLLINTTATVGECDGRTVKAEPGALQFRDMSRLTASRLDSVDLMSIMIPRNLAPPSLLGPAMHGVALPPTTSGVRLVRAHMRALLDEAEHLPDVALDTAIQALLLLAGRVAGVETPIGTPELSSLQGTVRRSAVDYIERRLLAGDIAFDIDLLSPSVGVSRATLYRAFDGDGGVNRYIQDRRLHHARLALQRRKEVQTITEIAYDHGFASPNHFSRLFRARYGYPPSEIEVQKAKHDVTMSDGPIRHDLLSAWLSEIRAQGAVSPTLESLHFAHLPHSG